MNYGYIRVSSEKQTVENQRYEIMQYCKRKGLVIDRWIEESVSGARHPNVRKLGKILHKINGSYIPPDPKPGGYNLCL